MIKRMLSITLLLCLSLSVLAHNSNHNPFFSKSFKPQSFSMKKNMANNFKTGLKPLGMFELSKKYWRPWKPGKKVSQWAKRKWKGIPLKLKKRKYCKGKYCKFHPKYKNPIIDPPIPDEPDPAEEEGEEPIPDGAPIDQDPVVDGGDQGNGDNGDQGNTDDGVGGDIDDQDPKVPGDDSPPLDGPEPLLACTGGLYGIDNYAENGKAVLYHIDIDSGISTPLTGSTFSASNLASYNNKLYYIHQISSETRASSLVAYDPATEQETIVANTESYPIYRFAINPIDGVMKATSRTYLYHFDMTTAEKTVIGQLSYAEDDFKHGDLGYSYDGHLLYLLTGKGLYSLDTEDTELVHIADHGIDQASGIVTSNDNRTFVSAGNEEGGADIYEIDLSSGMGEKLFSVPHHVNDLAYIPNYCE